MKENNELTNQAGQITDNHQSQATVPQQTSEPDFQRPVQSKPKLSIEKWPVGAFIGIILLAFGMGGYLVYQKMHSARPLPESITNGSTASPDPSLMAQPTSVQANPAYPVSLDISTWKTFINPTLGFTFKYPSEWGEVNEKIEDAVEANTGDSGKTYTLSFSELKTRPGDWDNRISGLGFSFDYSAGREWNGYRGEPDRPKGVKSTVWVSPPGCGTLRYRGQIHFNLPLGKEINGITLDMPTISQEQIEKLDAGSGIGVEDARAEHELCRGENTQKEAKQYISETEKMQLDGLSEQQLQVFKLILESSKVL